MERLFWLLLLVSPLTFGFTLTWDNPSDSDLATVNLYQSTQPGVYGAPMATVPANGPGLSQSYTAPDPAPGTYYWTAKACDAAGNCSVPSNEVTKTFLDVTAPGAPGNLRVYD